MVRKKVRSLIVCHVVLSTMVLLTSCSQSGATVASNASSSNANPPNARPMAENGSEPATAPNIASDIDACKLISKAEAEQAMGEKLRDADSGPASTAGGTICMYGSPDTMSAKRVTIRVESPNFNWAKVKEDKRIEGERMQPKRGRIRQVPGLGKDAYFARHVLHVLTDKGILTIIVFKDAADAAAGEETETKTEAIEKALAEKAVARM